MVRPIEISDVLSKVPVAERIQQSTRAVPEAVQQFQRELGEKLAEEQATKTQPAPPGDQVILHVEEQEKDRRKRRDRRDGARSNSSDPSSADETPDSEPPASSGHIDIRI